MKNLFLLILAIACFMIAAMLEILSLETKKEKPDKHIEGEIITIHATTDIIYADLYNLQIYFERSNDIHNFQDRKQLFSFLEIKSKQLSREMKEYQVELDFDTVRVYDYGRYVDCYIIGKTLSQFDEICALDNR